MNALDLLVDFTNFISTSVEPMPNQDENPGAYTGSGHDTGASPLNSNQSLPFERYHSTQRTPKETVLHSLAADEPSWHILPRSSGYIYDCRMTNNEYQGPRAPSILQDDYTSRVFDEYLQENPDVDPPSKLASVTPQSWPQQPEASPQWNACYKTNFTLRSVLDTWYDAQTPRPFEPLQQRLNAPYEQVQLLCNNPPSQCWTQRPQSHYPAENTWPTWGATEEPFDHDFLPEHNEWTLSNNPSTQLNTA